MTDIKKILLLTTLTFMSFLTCHLQNQVDRLCYRKLHTLGDNEQEEPKRKNTESKNINIMGITEKYSS